MDISTITSGLAQEYGYSESQIHNMLAGRMDKYQKLLSQVDETLAARELGKKITVDKEMILPAVGCSLGNIDIAACLRNLAKRDPAAYEDAAATLTSGEDDKFMSALKEITMQTQTTLLTEFAKFDQGGAARFVNNLSQLTALTSTVQYTKEELEELNASRLNHLTASVASIVGLDEAALARTIRGIQVYV